MKFTETIYTKTEGRIAHITFESARANALSLDLLIRLEKAIQNAGQNDEISAVLLKSEGTGTFCSGANLRELVAIDNQNCATAFFQGFAQVLLAMRTCPKIILGRIQGKAVGGGVGLIAGCDYVLSCEKAPVKLSELSLGLAPLVIEPTVSHRIGKSAFCELSLNPSEWKSAYWCKEKGLYNKVFENVKDLDKELGYFAEKINTYNPKALENLKKTSWQGVPIWDNLLEQRSEMSGKLLLGQVCKKQLEKFKS